MRPIGWEQRIDEYVQHNLNKPFCPYDHDCVKFTLRGICYIFELDILASIPAWIDQEEGKRVILQLSKGKGLKEAVTSVLSNFNFTPEPIAFASRGDVVIQDTPNGDTCTLCIGSKVCTPGKEKLEFFTPNGVCLKYKG